MTVQVLIAFIFGAVFVIMLLVVALFIKTPTRSQEATFRTILALAAAGVAAMIPGFIELELNAITGMIIRAGGAIAVFVIVYFKTPALTRGHQEVKELKKPENLKTSSSEGKLEISDVVVSPDEEGNTCLLDFRVHNTGKSEVVINRVSLFASSVLTIGSFGHCEFSKVYDLDISTLGKGETIKHILSQVVKPGEVDRFGIILIARQMGIGAIRGWNLKPTLHTNFGDVSWDFVEVWLPFNVPDDAIKHHKEFIVKRKKELEESFRKTKDLVKNAEITKDEADTDLLNIRNHIDDIDKYNS